MKCPKAIIFDLDGTLIHSAPDLHAATNAMLQAHKRPLLDYRVSVRASTKDRMPFFCNINDITEQKTINEYALGGMGAWGFVYAPYYAELLIREILEEKPLVNLKLDSLLRIKRLL